MIAWQPDPLPGGRATASQRGAPVADGRWVVARGVDVAAVLGHPAAVIGPAVASDGGLAAARLRLVDPGITYERRANLRIPASLVLR